ncbi:MAG: DNA-3-methyladenine glycosylase [Vicinamibacterales bacterium]
MALDIRKARRHFAEVDPVMAALVRRIGPCRLDTRVAPDPFEALVRAIVAQQVSAKAARTVFARVRAAVAGRRLAPRAMLALDDDVLRATGLGPTKTGYVKDLAAHVVDGRLPLARLGTMDDAEVVRRLTAVRGIGVWTAEVFLIFQLQRLDVFPAGDLALLTAMTGIYGLPARPTPARARAVAETWRPFRSIGSWYLWRSLDQIAPLPVATGVPIAGARSASRSRG